MSLQQTVAEAVTQARTTRTDSQSVEIKSGSGGAPKTISETISAFANGEGGLIILGIDERHGFTAATIKPTQLADTLATGCAEQVESPIRADVEIVEFEGSMVVAAPGSAGSHQPRWPIRRDQRRDTAGGERHIHAEPSACQVA